MKTLCGPLGLLLMAIVGLSGCVGGALQSHTSPTPHPSVSATVDQQRCARLAKRGFVPCPPTPDRMPLPPTTIRNATTGAVSDATAKQWGRAFQLAQAYYYWVVQNGARDALTSGVLADPSPYAVNTLFGGDLADLDQAKQLGGVLVYQPPSTPITQAVVVPATLQNQMQRQNLMSTPYALAVRFTGPSRRAVRLSDGRETNIRARDASFVVDALYWGQLKNDPDLGPIWYENGVYGCQGEVQNVCQL
jgi:hypothetical protein